MTNRTLWIASLLLAAFASVAFGGGDERGRGRLYGRRIVVEISARDKATFAHGLYGSVLSPKEIAGELARWLEQMSGREFEIEAASTSTDNLVGAICLLRADSALVAAGDRDRLKDKGLEAFIIRGDASRLQIIANDPRGLSHGVYFYLEQLGVRWLLAGANWTIVPARSDITLAIDRLVQPAFFSRGYFGTGGFYSWVFGRRYTGSAASREERCFRIRERLDQLVATSPQRRAGTRSCHGRSLHLRQEDPGDPQNAPGIPGKDRRGPYEALYSRRTRRRPRRVHLGQERQRLRQGKLRRGRGLTISTSLPS